MFPIRSITRGITRSLPSTVRYTAVRAYTQSAKMASQEPSGTTEPAPPTYTPRYIDIGINLADPIFRGKQHGKRRHPDDLDAVIGRAKQVGCSKLIVTGSDFKSNRQALELAKEYPGVVYATAGIHPCSSAIFGSKHVVHETEDHEPDHTAPCQSDPTAPNAEDDQPDPAKSADITVKLTTFIAEATSLGHQHLVAFGEFGLDYDRLEHCSRAIQLHSFETQLKVAAALEPQLPLFLHSRAAHEDFVRLLKAAFGSKLENLAKGGVVHSFTGTIDEARELMDLGLYIGINGCSFKTAENCDVVKQIDLQKMMIETDGPWCEVRPSHEGYKHLIEKREPVQNGTAPESQAQQKPKKNQKKEPDFPQRFKTVKKEKWEEGALVKGRNEPCSIEYIAKIIAGIKEISIEEVCEVTWKNTVQVFGLDE